MSTSSDWSNFEFACLLSDLPAPVSRRCVEVNSHSLILFRHPPAAASASDSTEHVLGVNVSAVSPVEQCLVLPDGSRLMCIDSICSHMGGPLVEGEIEECVTVSASSSSSSASLSDTNTGTVRTMTQTHPVIICPWHRYRFSLLTGEGFYQSLQRQWTSKGVRQRNHRLRIVDQQVHVSVNRSKHPNYKDTDHYNIKTDEVAQNSQSHSRLNSSTANATVTANVTLPARSGQIMAANAASASGS